MSLSLLYEKVQKKAVVKSLVRSYRKNDKRKKGKRKKEDEKRLSGSRKFVLVFSAKKKQRKSFSLFLLS